MSCCTYYSALPSQAQQMVFRRRIICPNIVAFQYPCPMPMDGDEMRWMPSPHQMTLNKLVPKGSRAQPQCFGSWGHMLQA